MQADATRLQKGALMRYSQELTIPFFMVTEDGALSVANLVNLIQQTSERQLAGSASQTELVKQYNIGWVITQSQIEITRLPTAEEKVTVWTEATAYNRLLCYRDYGITDAAGNELVLVHSTWVMFDLTTRKIIPIIDELVAGFGAEKMTRVKRLPRLPHPEAFDGQRDYWVIGRAHV